jgi:hypothetical protein
MEHPEYIHLQLRKILQLPIGEYKNHKLFDDLLEKHMSYSILSSSNITGFLPSGYACLGFSPSFSQGNLAPYRTENA